MKITPLDIYQQEFKRVLRGFDPDEVEDFLERIADDYEQLIKENASLEQKIESLESQLAMDGKVVQENESGMIAGQEADNVIREAKKEAESIIREAKKEADNIIQRASDEMPESVPEQKKRTDEKISEDAGPPLSEASAEASELIKKAKMEELELRREISRLRGQKERFLIEYRELLEKHLRNLTERPGEQMGE